MGVADSLSMAHKDYVSEQERFRAAAAELSKLPYEHAQKSMDAAAKRMKKPEAISLIGKRKLA